MQKLRELGPFVGETAEVRRALETELSAELDDLLEAYALAAGRLEELCKPEQPDQSLLFEYEVASRGIEEEVTRRLVAIHGNPPPVSNTYASHENGCQGRIRVRASWQTSL
ncbi:hypothetical protein [Ensifer canadensis]